MTHTEQSLSGLVIGGKYRVEELIASGGMGKVYRATHVEIGRVVAIKYLRRKYIDNPEAIQRFQQEARLAGSVGHGNILEVTDMGIDTDGSPYLVMPFLSGTSLDKLLENAEHLPLSRILDIVSQALAGLDAAHQKRIVHRDLKPSNIFVTQMGDREDFVKLLDFGISKVLDQTPISQLTQTGAALGTPHYMAPEQAQGAKEIDFRVDIYSAGVILYEALTGRRPFEGKSYNELMFKIVSEPFPMPTTLNPQIPDAVEYVIIKAMARNRNDRYATADQMRRALLTCPSGFLFTDGADQNSILITARRTAARFTPADSTQSGKVELSTGIPVSGRQRWLWLVLLITVITAGVVGFYWSSLGNEPPKDATSRRDKGAVGPASAPPVIEPKRVVTPAVLETVDAGQVSETPRSDEVDPQPPAPIRTTVQKKKKRTRKRTTKRSKERTGKMMQGPGESTFFTDYGD